MIAMSMQRDSERHGRRRGRNWAVLIALVALIGLLFAVTIVKLGPNAANPSAHESWGAALVEWLSTDGNAGQAPEGNPE